MTEKKYERFKLKEGEEATIRFLDDIHDDTWSYSIKLPVVRNIGPLTMLEKFDVATGLDCFPVSNETDSHWLIRCLNKMSLQEARAFVQGFWSRPNFKFAIDYIAHRSAYDHVAMPRKAEQAYERAMKGI